MADINIGLLTVMVGMMGILLGTFLGPYLNHRLNVKYNRKDLLFKRKLEYFEQITNTIEGNIKNYSKSVREIEETENKIKFTQVLKKLKLVRKNFNIMASPLYMNIKNISRHIIEFVNIEKDIFYEFEKLPTTKDKQQKIRILKDLENKINKLNLIGNRAIYLMRNELEK